MTKIPKGKKCKTLSGDVLEELQRLFPNPGFHPIFKIWISSSSFTMSKAAEHLADVFSLTCLFISLTCWWCRRTFFWIWETKDAPPLTCCASAFLQRLHLSSVTPCFSSEEAQNSSTLEAMVSWCAVTMVIKIVWIVSYFIGMIINCLDRI